EMIAGGAPYFSPLLQPVVADLLLFNQAIATLLTYSLLNRNADDSILSIHRLVQAVLQDAITIETGRQWKERAIHVVDATFPAVEFTRWSACERYLPHALLCATWAEQAQIAIPAVAHLLNETGYYLNERARYIEAEPLYQRSLSIREQQVGTEHPDVASILGNLAALYQAQEKHEQAEPLYQRALAIDEKAYGPEHPNVAADLNNLAAIYQLQEKYEQAEPLYRHALEIKEQQLELEHLSIARSINNLANLYYRQGKYEQAEPLLVRSLAIREQQLGP